MMCVTRGRDSSRGTPASLSKSTPHQYENPMSTKSRSTSTGRGPADTPDTSDTEDAKEAKMREVLTVIAKDPSTVINLKAIARDYDVPYDTLRRRYRNETKPRKLAHTHRQVLTPAQEEKIVDWSIFLSIQGRPVDKDTLSPKLVELCPSWAGTGGPSNHWWELFFKRHPEIKLRKVSGIPPKRAQAFNFTAVNGLFDLINGIRKGSNIPWKLVLNPDEKGLQTGSRKTDQKKCIIPFDAPNTIKLQSDNLRLVTIIECITAEGVAFDPAFIFPGEGHFEGWYDVEGFEDSKHV